jgi:hypothetical protein
MTKITVAQLIELAQAAGCEVQEQKKFYKITSPSGNRKALYVGRTKQVVTRIDIAGFDAADHAAIFPLTAEEAKDLNLGAVRGQILPPKDEDITDEMVTEAFELCLGSLLDGTEGFKFAPKAKEEPAVEELVEESTEEELVEESTEEDLASEVA